MMSTRRYSASLVKKFLSVWNASKCHKKPKKIVIHRNQIHLNRFYNL